MKYIYRERDHRHTHTHKLHESFYITSMKVNHVYIKCQMKFLGTQSFH
jgi:hypothetical protein